MITSFNSVVPIKGKINDLFRENREISALKNFYSTYDWIQITKGIEFQCFEVTGEGRPEALTK